MDEFDVYLARSYGGGQTSSSTPQPHNDVTTNRLALHSNHRPGRRHSSVGLRCSADVIEDQSSTPSEITSRAGRRKHDPMGSDVMSARRKLSATVMVAVEPPSPTELRHRYLPVEDDNVVCDGNLFPNSAAGSEDPNENSDNKAADRKQFNRIQVGLKHQSVLTSSGQDETAESGGYRRGSGKQDESAASRPERLSLETPQCDGNLGVAISGDTSPEQVRRQSTACTPDTHRLVISDQPSPGAPRRNSCNGILSSSGLRPPPSGSLSSFNPPNALSSVGSGSQTGLLHITNSGRRNSAITYLTDSTGMLAAPGRCSPRQVELDGRRSFSADGAIVNPAQLHLLRKLAARSHGNDSGDQSPDGVLRQQSASTAVASLQSVAEKSVCRVAVLGAHEVGKTTLTNQLLTSEYLANKENFPEEDNEDRLTSILLDNEETTVQFIDDQSAEEAFRDNDNSIDAFLVVYSVTDRSSFSYAQTCLQDAARRQQRRANIDSVVVLVANKQDLVRNRIVCTADGKRLASKRHCKFLEVSALLDHKVDEVLVTIVRESRARMRRRCLFEAGGGSCNFGDDLTASDSSGKSCIQRAAFAIFRKFFK